ncbi:hypothetical protein DPMN_021697 [Dreissena polymorpha]|uniref:Uncharacterized protein n=1 Tax=Dreissena polymorpha TaxID=45954 RepID=A0A9D4S9E1_DREPO|nr:hypothetical protein DPMN_021697 [Dreissena polymorpha]
MESKCSIKSMNQNSQTGAESVVSLAHHYFQHFGVGEKHAEIHFDNSIGQNKNHTIVWYAMWQPLTIMRFEFAH